jgi:molecular chaperone GrpE
MSIAHYRKTLEKQGVRVIETAGKNFDPNFHEAMGFEKSELPSGQIVRVQALGYLLHDRLLRPAKVTVSNGQS